MNRVIIKMASFSTSMLEIEDLQNKGNELLR